MKERNIISHFLTNTSSDLHKTRINAIADCVVSILNGHALTVTTVGRGIDSNALPKHKIKRMDRLCSNPHLYNEIDVIYGSICKQWVPEYSRPVILIDWSDLDDCKNAFLISASLAYDGRSITLYSQTHSLKTKEKPATHKAFLNKLKTLLPDTCNPIIVTDAGFKVPWFKLVLSLGWDYVGRVRKPNYYSYDEDKWHNITVLFEQATSCPKHKEGFITKSNPLKTSLVSYKNKAKNRHKLTANKTRCASKHSEQHARRGKEPWVLATSLPVTSKSAIKIVKIYKQRMQIEEAFRDMKSQLHGLGFNQSRSRKINRIAILILLAVLACMLLLIIGTAVECSGNHRRYQANSIKHRRVLSLQTLGLLVISDKRLILEFEEYLNAIKHMVRIIADNSQGYELRNDL